MRSLPRRLRAAVPAALAATIAIGAIGVPAAAAESTVLITGEPAAVGAARAGLSAGDGFTDLPVIGGFSAPVTAAQRAALTAQPGLTVTDNAAVRVTDADYGAGSGTASAVYPQAIGAPAAWSKGITGTGVTVAVVDTGIDDSGDLAGKVVGGYDFSGEGDPTADSFGHGTFVAGLIAGTGEASNGAVKGVAPGARLVSLKVAGADGSSDVVRVIAAIQWAVNHAKSDNIRVLNLSLGTDSTQDWRIDPLNAAVEGAWRSGMVVTVAAGNNGAGGISKPGDDPYVITVGATDDATTPGTGDDTVAPFSSVGPTAAGLAKPDLVAPGAHVVSTRSSGSAIDQAHPEARIAPAYFKGSGTSFSAPQAAGAAALLIQQRPAITANQVKGQLKATAVPLPDAPATAQGAGILDIPALLAAPTGPAANGGLGTSTGSGSIEESQGSLDEAAPATGGSDAVLDASPWDGAAWNGAAWNGAAWNGAAWNGAAWNGAAWNGAAWNGAAWNGAAWNGAAWNGAAWNGAAWNGAAWNGAAWNGAAWNGAAWNGAAWNGAAWNGAAWNANGWASAGFWSSAWN